MKHHNFVLKLVFGILGAIYTVLGGVLLTVAAASAGEIRRIFTLPEGEVVFAINGTVFTALGVIFLLVALLLARAERRRARMREELLRFGARVQGTIVDVRVDYSVKVNRRSPLIARVQCMLPGGEVTLKSHRLWNACPATGETVEVIYDPMDERRYVIEFPEE